MSDVRPPIPVRLIDRPTTGGLVAPWLNVALADGGTDFRQADGTRWRRAWTEGLCQVCGKPLDALMVFLGGPDQRYFDEPPLHPECAHYVTRACPMVAGRMSHFRKGPSVTEGKRGKACTTPGCDCGGYVPSEAVLLPDGGAASIVATDRTGNEGRPAHPWFAVYARTYQLAATPDGQLLGGIPRDVIRTRQVSR